MKQGDYHKAFTLIELLVCIIIIAVLLSIILPALKGAREQARISRCSSNLRSMATATINYEINNRYYPYVADLDPFALWIALDGYADLSEPSAPNYIEPWACPSDNMNDIWPQAMYYYTGTSYAYYPGVIWRSNPRIVMATYMACNYRLPLFHDGRAFHLNHRTTNLLNASYPDGHIAFDFHY